VQFLENDAASFHLGRGTVNVLGCTLWTDYQLHETPEASMRAAQARMNDHRFITQKGVNFTPADALVLHEKSRLWLHKKLARLCADNPRAKNLIVTHHAPDGAYLGTRTGDIAPAYGSDLLAEFAPWRPVGWIHGHTHFRHETMQNGIRVVSAPRGYVAYDGEEALEFQPGILEI
jgi:Icc-related predicted phosphoesterase